MMNKEKYQHHISVCNRPEPIGGYAYYGFFLPKQAFYSSIAQFYLDLNLQVHFL